MEIIDFKKLLFVLMLFFYVTSVNAQDIVGRWQAGSPQLSNDFNENYQFYSNGTFVFNTDGDNGLNRIMKINGNYHISNLKIFFIAKNYTELTAGNLKFTGVEPGESTWQFEGDIPNVIKINNPTEQEGSIKIYREGKNLILEIDGSKYYQVGSNPDKY